MLCPAKYMYVEADLPHFRDKDIYADRNPLASDP